MKTRKGFLKMSEQKLNTKIRQDVAKVQTDLTNLVGDGAVQLSKFENNIRQTAEGLTTWVDDSVTDLSDGIEKAADDARDSVVDAAATLNKDVRRGLSQYNAKAQEVANKVPGNFGKKAARYPWVSMSIALVVGFLLGLAFLPTRRPLLQV
jgi:ElaB/YqjD/DUF883 family membrane-anchored ribosome-binding protein